MTVDQDHLDDDNRIDVYALFIFDADIPHSMINEVLSLNAAESDLCHYLWPASTYSALPPIRHYPHPEVPPPPIPAYWKSPFIGKTIQQAARFVKRAPKPLCRTFFAVLEKEKFETEGLVRICKILGDGSVQSFFYDGDDLTTYMMCHDRDTWEETWRGLEGEWVGA